MDLTLLELQIDIDTMPSFSTFRRAHIGLDFTAFSDAFRQWMQPFINLDEDIYAGSPGFTLIRQTYV